MVVKALGAEWHGECFCCMVSPDSELLVCACEGVESANRRQECNGPFKDGRYFLRGEDRPVCVACEERRLKA